MTMTLRKPLNIIVIMTDQQRFDSLGCTGSSIAQTPNLDALAQQGVLFQNHFVTNPVCSPSRGSIMTGKYINEHGLWGNGCTLPRQHLTVPDALKRAGYQTAHFGKLHLVPIINRTEPHPDYGFDTCEVSEGDQQLIDDAHFRWLRKNHPDVFLSYLNEMWRMGHAQGFASCIPEELHLTTWTAGRAMEWLERGRNPDRPFFLQVSWFDPHHAFNPCEPHASHFLNRTDAPQPFFDEAALATRPPHYHARIEGNATTGNAGNAGITRNPETMDRITLAYHAMIHHVDVNVGRIVDTVRRLGLEKDTVILFTSDHGEFLGAHGMLYKGPFMLDDLLHVPMIAAIPDGEQRAVACDDLTSGVDIMATAMAAAGGAGGSDTGGRAMLNDDLRVCPEGRREFVLAEWEDADLSHPTNGMRCVRTHEHKLVAYRDRTIGELYDLERDPHESHNRYNDPAYASVQQNLFGLLGTCYQASRPAVRRECAW